jgi:hypothetical protein
MSRSLLFSKAASTLPPHDRDRLAHVLDWMNRHVWSNPDYFPKTAWNIRNEHNLVGDDSPDGCDAYARFLRDVSQLDAVAEEDRYLLYQSVCDAFLMKGRTISNDVLGPHLYRYVMLGAIRAWGKVVGMPAYWSTLLDTEPHQAFDQLIEQIHADLTLLEVLDLGPHGRPVWATFDDPDQGLDPQVRDDATLMAHHLGLRVGLTRADWLIVLIYQKHYLKSARYPTVADAGWEHRFRSADPRTHEWGLTAASGKFVPQPEVVHANCPLAILERMPRFLGTVMPESI